jgi:hypothetical protein
MKIKRSVVKKSSFRKRSVPYRVTWSPFVKNIERKSSKKSRKIVPSVVLFKNGDEKTMKLEGRLYVEIDKNNHMTISVRNLKKKTSFVINIDKGRIKSTKTPVYEGKLSETPSDDKFKIKIEFGDIIFVKSTQKTIIKNPNCNEFDISWLEDIQNLYRSSALNIDKGQNIYGKSSGKQQSKQGTQVSSVKNLFKSNKSLVKKNSRVRSILKHSNKNSMKVKQSKNKQSKEKQSKQSQNKFKQAKESKRKKDKEKIVQNVRKISKKSQTSIKSNTYHKEKKFAKKPSFVKYARKKKYEKKFINTK